MVDHRSIESIQVIQVSAANQKKMLSSSDEEEPAPPPIKMDSWISHVSPPKEPAPDMGGPPSPPMLSLGVKKSTYVRYVFFFFRKKIESIRYERNHNTHTFTFLLSNSLHYFEFKLNKPRTTTQIMKMAMRNESLGRWISAGKMMESVHMADLCKTVIVKDRKLEVLSAKMNNIGPKGSFDCDIN